MISKNKDITNKKIVWNLTFLILFSAIGIFILTSKVDELNITSCKFKEITGLGCPTCGMTRSISTLLDFNLMDSFNYHLMGPILFFSLFLLNIKLFLEIVLHKEIQLKFIKLYRRKIVILTFFIWTMFWFGRMYTEL